MEFQFLTAPQMAQQLGASPQRLRYFLKSRGIEPAARIGNILIFSPDVLPRLEAILRQLEARRAELHPTPTQEMDVVNV